MEKSLLDSCKRIFDSFFRIVDKNRGAILNSMEFFCTNDCFKRFKSTHQLVTNYDVDEFIFPRHFKSNDLAPFEQIVASKCENVLNNRNTSRLTGSYNSYDYFMGLIEKEKSKRDESMSMMATTTKIAALKFKNSFVVQDIDEAFFDTLFSSNNRWLDLAYRGNKSVRLRVTTNDEYLINSLYNVHYLIGCLNRSIVHGRRLFDTKWNSPYTVSLIKGREKSVFNTNYTEVINQHETDLIQDDSVSVDVGLDDGYSSHFRDDLENWFNGQTILFTNFRIDLEYYFFLAFLSYK